MLVLATHEPLKLCKWKGAAELYNVGIVAAHRSQALKFEHGYLDTMLDEKFKLSSITVTDMTVTSITVTFTHQMKIQPRNEFVLSLCTYFWTKSGFANHTICVHLEFNISYGILLSLKLQHHLVIGRFFCNQL
jgi:hypothetical protein